MLLTSLMYSTNSFVCSFNRNNSLLILASMPYHVWRCKIAHNKLAVALFDPINDSLSDFSDTHFRLKVICGNFRRGNHLPLFIYKGDFSSAIKKKSNMCILFRFCNVKLRTAKLGQMLC